MRSCLLAILILASIDDRIWSFEPPKTKIGEKRETQAAPKTPQQRFVTLSQVEPKDKSKSDVKSSGSRQTSPKPNRKSIKYSPSATKASYSQELPLPEPIQYQTLEPLPLRTDNTEQPAPSPSTACRLGSTRLQVQEFSYYFRPYQYTHVWSQRSMENGSTSNAYDNRFVETIFGNSENILSK
jgi:hypothetical protein